MLEDFETIAGQLGLTFIYGEQKAANVDADKIARWDGPLLYFSGYLNVLMEEDAQGAWKDTNDVLIFLLKPSQLSDVPETRLPTMNEMLGITRKIVKKVRTAYVVTGVRAVGVKNMFDRNMDGVRVTFQAVNKYPIPGC